MKRYLVCNEKQKARLHFTHEVFKLCTCLLGMGRRKFVTAYLQLQSKFEMIFEFLIQSELAFYTSNLFALFTQSMKNLITKGQIRRQKVSLGHGN